MCCDTRDRPSQSSSRHVAEKPRVVILLETKNAPFHSHVFHASKSYEQLKIIKKKRRFEHLENSNV